MRGKDEFRAEVTKGHTIAGVAYWNGGFDSILQVLFREALLSTQDVSIEPNSQSHSNLIAVE